MRDIIKEIKKTDVTIFDISKFEELLIKYKQPFPFSDGEVTIIEKKIIDHYTTKFKDSENQDFYKVRFLSEIDHLKRRFFDDLKSVQVASHHFVAPMYSVYLYDLLSDLCNNDFEKTVNKRPLIKLECDVSVLMLLFEKLDERIINLPSNYRISQLIADNFKKESHQSINVATIKSMFSQKTYQKKESELKEILISIASEL